MKRELSSADFTVYDTCRIEQTGPERSQKASGNLVRIPPKEVVSMLPRQVPVFRRLRGAPNFILNCPTGWGKSKMIQFLLLYDLYMNRNRKAVIIIPQNAIAPGFVEAARMEVPGCGEVQWNVHKDLCQQVQGKSALLRDFLVNGRGKLPSDRIIVTSHSCFVKACAGLDLRTVLADVTLVVDECHHIQTEGRGDTQFNSDMNQLGRIVHDLLQADVTSTKLWLATATPGRGDGSVVIREEDLDKFTVQRVQFEDYWKTLRYLKRFRNAFAVYKGNKQFQMLAGLCQTVKKTLVYSPPERSQFLGRLSKSDFISRTKAVLQQAHPGAVLWTTGASTKVPDTTYIIDMTNERNRDEKIAFLRRHGDLVYAVLAVGRMKEGADWPQLQRVVDFCPSFMSMTLRIQKFGRGTRDYPGKVEFEYFTCLPKIRRKSPDDLRKACSEHFGQLIVSMVDSLYYYGEGRWNANGVRLDNSDEIAMVKSAVREVISQFAIDPDSTKEDIERAIAIGVDANADLSDEQRQKVIKAIYKTLQRQAAANRSGPNWAKRPHASVVDHLGFDAVGVTASQIRDSLHTFCTGACGLRTFQQVRKLLNSEKGIEFREMAQRARAWALTKGQGSIKPLLETP